jgi:surface polysaccharide O-acyltransferase-like enzyme
MRAATFSPAGTRLVGLESGRGLAVLVMVLDHVLIVTGYVDSPVRATVTRVAMPLFMVVAGALVGRLRARRLLRVAIAGLALPLFVPWIDNPNILLLYGLGAVGVAAARWAAGRSGLWVLLVAAVAGLANGYGDLGTGYPLPSVVALMCAGALVGRGPLDQAFGWLRRRGLLWLSSIGRRPLAVYIGHLAVLRLLEGVLA